MAILSWVNLNSGFWDAVANWLNNSAPGSETAADDVVIDVAGDITTTHRQGTTNINSLTSAEAFTLSGGTLTANTIDVNNTFTISGGTLRNATIDLTGGTLQFVGGFGNVLDGVTVNGDLNVTNSTATLTNGSVFTGGNANINGATLIVNTANGLNNKTVTLTNQSLLSIGQTQTISDTTFNFGRGNLQIGGTNSVVTLGAGSQMSFAGAAIGISGAANSGSSHFVNAGTVRFANGFGGSTPTIGTVLFTNQGTLDANTSASLAIGNLSTIWTNSGTINVNTTNNTSASIVNFAGNWDNNGVVNLGNNGTLNLGGTFDTDDIGAIARTGTNTIQITGALNNANATLTLNSTTGDYTLAGGTITGGTISQNGAALRFGSGTSTLNDVAIQGDLVSTGTSVQLNNISVTGNVAINGGQTSFNTATNLDGRTISATSQSVLTFGQSQTINNSTINLSGGAALQLANPNNTLTLGTQTQLNLTNANTSVRPAFTGAAGSRLINNGTITAIGGAGGSNPPNISTAFFTNNGRVQAYSAGILNLGTTNTVWSNEGAIDVNLINNTSTSTVRFLGDWDNNGTVNLGNNAALELGGTFNTADIGISNITRTGTNTISITGILDNTGATFALNSSTGNYTLNGGTIRGGTLTQTGDAGLRYTSNVNNRLDGVTVAGDLTVSAGSVELINGTSFTGGANVNSSGTLLINTVTNLNNKTLNATSQSVLAVGQSQTIDNSVINISGGSSLQVNNASTQLVLGPQTQVNVSGANSNLRQAFSGANGASLVNQGTITFSGASGQGVSVLPFNNQGTVRVQNGSTTQISNLTNFAGGTLTGGTYEVGANSRLFLLGANIVNNAANLVFDGANSNLFSAVGTTAGTDVNALAGFAANLAAGDVTIRNGRNLSTAGNLSNAGDFTVGTNSTLTVGGNYLQTGGSTVLRGGTLTAIGGTINLQNGNFSGFGTINGTVLDSGVLAADALTGDININGSYDQANDSVLNLEIGGLNEGQFDQINITGTADLEGVLNVSFVNGFESSLKVGDAFELLTFNGYTGNFSAINLPTLANPDLRLVSILQNNRLLVTVLDNRNNIPVAVADTLTATEGTIFSGTVADALLRNDIDLDGDSLTVTGIDTSTTQGIVTLVGNQLTYNPNGKFESLGAGETATDTFSYSITDGRQGTATATVSVVITGQNDAPIATDDAVSTLRNTPITISAATLLGNDRDIDVNDVLSITGVGNATNGMVALNANGDIVFTPTTGFNGNANFTYTVSDGKGGSDTGSVAVTVNAPLNVAPVAGNDAITANENNALTVAANTLLANDTDANGDVLTISAVNGSTTQGLVALNPNGNITYNPNGKFESLAAGETATDTFSYTVNDGNGGTSTATVTVTINGVNDAPVAVNQTATTTENAATTIDVLSSATDVDASDILSVSAVNTTNTRGSVSINPDGTLSYTPNGQFESLGQGATAIDSFSYTVSDGKGGTSTATINVTITGLNDAPVAVADAVATTRDTVLTLTAASLLANDRDIDSGDILSLIGVGNAVNGSVTINDSGNVVFTPGTGFTGNASFSYTIADQAGVTSTANVTVSVNPDQGEVLSGLGGRKRFTIPRGSGTTTIAGFGGVGRGDRPSPAIIAEADTLVFQGADLIARNLLLDQVGSDLELTFENVGNTKVVLKDFALENLDNLRTSNGASVNLANIFFNGDTSIRDSFDVFDANSTRNRVLRANTVTFLNDLNNVVRGFDGSADVINGQGGNDTLYGLEGNDLLRGGTGNDFLYGDAGDDRLVGGLGADQFVFRTGEAFEASDLGVDTIVDFNGAEGDKIALRRRTFASLSSPVGNGLNANDFAVINAPTNGSAGSLAARIIYNQGTGDLIYNQNGAASGLGSGGRFATLTASPTLTANDFRVFA